MERLNPVVKAAAIRISIGALILSFTYSLMLNGLILFLSIVPSPVLLEGEEKDLGQNPDTGFFGCSGNLFYRLLFLQSGGCFPASEKRQPEFCPCLHLGSSFYNGLKLAARIYPSLFWGFSLP